MQLLDPHHPFFDPVWRRVAVVLVCVGWGIVEFVNDAAVWGALFVTIGAVAAHQLFIVRKRDRETKDDDSEKY